MVIIQSQTQTQEMYLQQTTCINVRFRFEIWNALHYIGINQLNRNLDVSQMLHNSSF